MERWRMMTLWSGGGGGREGVLIKHQQLKFVLPPWRDLSPFPLSSSPSSLFPSLLLLFLLFISPLAAACASNAYLNEKMGEERRVGDIQERGGGKRPKFHIWNKTTPNLRVRVLSMRESRDQIPKKLESNQYE